MSPAGGLSLLGETRLHPCPRGPSECLCSCPRHRGLCPGRALPGAEQEGSPPALITVLPQHHPALMGGSSQRGGQGAAWIVTASKKGRLVPIKQTTTVITHPRVSDRDDCIRGHRVPCGGIWGPDRVLLASRGCGPGMPNHPQCPGRPQKRVTCRRVSGARMGGTLHSLLWGNKSLLTLDVQQTPRVHHRNQCLSHPHRVYTASWDLRSPVVAERRLLGSAEALTRGSPPAANTCRLCVASPFIQRPQEGLDPTPGPLDALRSCAAVATRWQHSPPHRLVPLAPVPAAQKHRLSLDTRRRNSCPLESVCAETCVIPIPSHRLPRHCRGSRQGPAHWTEWLPLGPGGGWGPGRERGPALRCFHTSMKCHQGPGCPGPPAWLWL